MGGVYPRQSPCTIRKSPTIPIVNPAKSSLVNQIDSYPRHKKLFQRFSDSHFSQLGRDHDNGGNATNDNGKTKRLICRHVIVVQFRAHRDWGNWFPTCSICTPFVFLFLVK